MVSYICLLKNKIINIYFHLGNVSSSTDFTKKQVLVDSSDAKNELECDSILTKSKNVEPGVLQQGI